MPTAQWLRDAWDKRAKNERIAIAFKRLDLVNVARDGVSGGMLPVAWRYGACCETLACAYVYVVRAETNRARDHR